MMKKLDKIVDSLMVDRDALREIVSIIGVQKSFLDEYGQSFKESLQAKYGKVKGAKMYSSFYNRAL